MNYYSRICVFFRTNHDFPFQTKLRLEHAQRSLELQKEAITRLTRKMSRLMKTDKMWSDLAWSDPSWSVTPFFAALRTKDLVYYPQRFYLFLLVQIWEKLLAFDCKCLKTTCYTLCVENIVFCRHRKSHFVHPFSSLAVMRSDLSMKVTFRTYGHNLPNI